MTRSASFSMLALLTLALTACAAPPKRTTSAKTAATAPARTTSNPVSPVPQRAQATAPAKPAAAPAPKPAPAPAPKPADPKDQYEQAVQLIEKNQFAEAEKLLNDVVKAFPTFSGPYTNLGIIYAKTNRRPQAIDAFSRAAVNNPRNPVAWNWLGLSYREANDLARSEQAYLRAIQADDDFAPAHLNLGILYDQYLKKPAQALEHYKRYRRLGGRDELRLEAWMAALEAQLAPNTGAKK